MTRYKTRPGVVLAEICGEYMLVACREARDSCPYAIHINETSAFLWKSMAEWGTMEDLLLKIHDEYEIEDAKEAEDSVKAYLTELSDLGYLITED